MPDRSHEHIPSPAEIEMVRTGRNGWTKAQLAEWGVSWPPPKGWKRELERRWLEAQKNRREAA